MSNEELVQVIQSGEDRIEELWNQMERLVRWKAKRIMTTLEGRGGVEFDDLYQSGYPALVEAVSTYKADSGSFSTWFMFYLKSAFAKAAGYRTQRENMEPLNNSLSLDMPMTDEADSALLIDFVPDQRAEAVMDAVEEKVWREQLSEAVGSVMQNLPEKNREVLRMRYWDNLTLEEVGLQQGLSREAVRNIEKQGIRQLRQPQSACHLKSFYDFNFYCHAGLSAFRRKGLSIQEQYMIIMEEREQRKARMQREEAQKLYEKIKLERLKETGRL